LTAGLVGRTADALIVDFVDDAFRLAIAYDCLLAPIFPDVPAVAVQAGVAE
jgi:hypothetical protein